MSKIKLNVGASPIWEKEGWYVLDHKLTENSDYRIAGDAISINLENDQVETIFCSHMFEHIPHVRLERILLEFNRILEPDGIVRILTPDLRKLTTAYVNNDKEFFNRILSEDESIRTDMGLGGMLMNFIVSPGQDTALFTRDIGEFIAGYAHLYCYDFEMLSVLLQRTGFHHVEEKAFTDSSVADYSEPLHVVGLAPVWRDFNQKYYNENDLIHYFDRDEGRYIINFTVTGFDRDPAHSLIIEAKKSETIDTTDYVSLNDSEQNYNHYAWSLLNDPTFANNYKKVTQALGVPNRYE